MFLFGFVNNCYLGIFKYFLHIYFLRNVILVTLQTLQSLVILHKSTHIIWKLNNLELQTVSS